MSELWRCRAICARTVQHASRNKLGSVGATGPKSAARAPVQAAQDRRIGQERCKLHHGDVSKGHPVLMDCSQEALPSRPQVQF